MPGTLISLRNFQYVHVYKSLMGRKYDFQCGGIPVCMRSHDIVGEVYLYTKPPSAV